MHECKNFLLINLKKSSVLYCKTFIIYIIILNSGLVQKQKIYKNIMHH